MRREKKRRKYVSVLRKWFTGRGNVNLSLRVKKPVTVYTIRRCLDFSDIL